MLTGSMIKHFHKSEGKLQVLGARQCVRLAHTIQNRSCKVQRVSSGVDRDVRVIGR